MDSTSGHFQHAEEMKKRLDEVSPSFCLAKWLQVNLHLTTGLTQSCFHPPTHKIPLDELARSPSALHNTREKKQQRKLMLEGQRPTGCEYCWKIEDAPGGHLSDRAIRSQESWAKQHFDEVVSSSFDRNINPRYVEVNFNHTCNFKCAYCSPHLSTSWAREAEELGPYPTLVPHNDSNHMKSVGLMPEYKVDENPYVKAFWQWWPELYKNLEVFRMTGGEPLMDKNTFRVLDWILENPKPDLNLAVTSNMCPPESMFKKFIERSSEALRTKSIGKLSLFASVDSAGEQAEYIRDGLDYRTFLGNCREYLKEIPNAELTFIVTMNALSVTNLKQLVQDFMDLQTEFNGSGSPRLFLDTPFLRYPDWMSLRVLTEDLHHHLAECIEFMSSHKTESMKDPVGIRKFWLGKILRAEEWMKSSVGEQELNRDRANFYRFFTEYDHRRNKSFSDTFPELSDFMKLCQSISESQ